MATDYEAMGSALHSRLGTAMGGKVYRDIAPQGVVPPYIIWGRVAGADEYTFNGSGITLEYYVKGVSNRLWNTQAYQAYGSAHALMQDAPLNVSGYTVLRVRRTSTFDYADNENFQHVGGNYAIEIWKT